MFSSIGWVEILVIVLLGLVIIGPERLPGVIMDVRAAIYAARKAIANAKAELNGEMSGLGAEFNDLRVPLSQAAEWTRMGPRGVITKALFDGDDSAWDDFNPKKMAEDIKKSTSPYEHDADMNNQPAQPAPEQNTGRPTFDYSQVYPDLGAQQTAGEKAKTTQPPRGGNAPTGEGSSSWEDVT